MSPGIITAHLLLLLYWLSHHPIPLHRLIRLNRAICTSTARYSDPHQQAILRYPLRQSPNCTAAPLDQTTTTVSQAVNQTIELPLLPSEREFETVPAHPPIRHNKHSTDATSHRVGNHLCSFLAFGHCPIPVGNCIGCSRPNRHCRLSTHHLIAAVNPHHVGFRVQAWPIVSSQVIITRWQLLQVEVRMDNCFPLRGAIASYI
jgi:hypothetical protein